MKHHLVWIMASVVAVMSGTETLCAGDTGETEVEGNKPKDFEAVLQDIDLTGKVQKAQKEGKDGQIIETYTLVLTDGQTIYLPWKKKEGSSLMNIDDYVGKEVKVVGKGKTFEKDGKKKTIIKKIISIENPGETITPPPLPGK